MLDGALSQNGGIVTTKFRVANLGALMKRGFISVFFFGYYSQILICRWVVLWISLGR